LQRRIELTFLRWYLLQLRDRLAWRWWCPADSGAAPGAWGCAPGSLRSTATVPDIQPAAEL